MRRHLALIASGFNRDNGWLFSAGMTLLKPFSRTPERGADTLVWLVDSPEVAGHSGGCYVDRRAVSLSPAARDMEAARRLWQVSDEQTQTAVAG